MSTHKITCNIPFKWFIEGIENDGELPECEITFTYQRGAKASWDDSGYAAEIDFLSAKWTGPPPHSIDVVEAASAFLETDGGRQMAIDAATERPDA